MRPIALHPRTLTLIVLLLFAALAGPAAAAPEGMMTWGLHVTLATRWLDPNETEAFINQFMVLYAIMGLGAPAGNAATRIEVYVTKNGIYSSGAVPEIEDLYQRQARELDRKKREGMLHQIQQILHDRVMHVPIYELAFLQGVGPASRKPASTTSRASRTPHRTRI